MIIPITSEYEITGNKHCWELQRAKQRRHRKTKAMITNWESFQYFNSIEKAVQNLAELMLRTAGAQTLVDALAEVDRVVATLSNALTPKFEVKVREDAA